MFYHSVSGKDFENPKSTHFEEEYFKNYSYLKDDLKIFNTIISYDRSIIQKIFNKQQNSNFENLKNKINTSFVEMEQTLDAEKYFLLDKKENKDSSISPLERDIKNMETTQVEDLDFDAI